MNMTFRSHAPRPQTRYSYPLLRSTRIDLNPLSLLRLLRYRRSFCVLVFGKYLFSSVTWRYITGDDCLEKENVSSYSGSRGCRDVTSYESGYCSSNAYFSLRKVT